MSDPTDVPRYERIGVGYARRRQPDPRIAAQIHGHLGSPAERPHVLNVGAGAGSYEPDDRRVTAVEPSPTMIAQRPDTVSREVVQAVGGAQQGPEALVSDRLAHGRGSSVRASIGASAVAQRSSSGM